MTDTLRPPPEFEHLPDHWLRHGDNLVPAGYSSFGARGRWALTDGCIYTDVGAWAAGLRYEKPCRPNAIVPDATKIADHIVREVRGLNPAGEPLGAMMLVTGEELHAIVVAAFKGDAG